MYLPSREPKPKPQVVLKAAIAQDLGLAALMARAKASNERYKVLATLVPDSIYRQVQAGMLSDTHWHLIVNGQAVANKLKHHLPDAQAHFAAKGWPTVEIVLRLRRHVNQEQRALASQLTASTTSHRHS